MRRLLAWILGVFAPLILIVVGAAIAGFGFEYGINVLGWTGIIMVGAGIVWGVILWLSSDGGSLFG